MRQTRDLGTTVAARAHAAATGCCPLLLWAPGAARAHAAATPLDIVDGVVAGLRPAALEIGTKT